MIAYEFYWLDPIRGYQHNWGTARKAKESIKNNPDIDYELGRENFW